MISSKTISGLKAYISSKASSPEYTEKISYFSSRISVTISIFVGSSSIILTPQEQDWVKDHPVVRVGNENDWAPFDFAEDGEAKGYSIDVLRLLSQKTGLKLTFVN